MNKSTTQCRTTDAALDEASQTPSPTLGRVRQVFVTCLSPPAKLGSFPLIQYQIRGLGKKREEKKRLNIICLHPISTNNMWALQALIFSVLVNKEAWDGREVPCCCRRVICAGLWPENPACYTTDLTPNIKKHTHSQRRPAPRALWLNICIIPVCRLCCRRFLKSRCQQPRGLISTVSSGFNTNRYLTSLTENETLPAGSSSTQGCKH